VTNFPSSRTKAICLAIPAIFIEPLPNIYGTIFQASKNRQTKNSYTKGPLLRFYDSGKHQILMTKKLQIHNYTVQLRNL
jgi:hypothetical protein